MVGAIRGAFFFCTNSGGVGNSRFVQCIGSLFTGCRGVVSSLRCCGRCCVVAGSMFGPGFETRVSSSTGVVGCSVGCSTSGVMSGRRVGRFTASDGVLGSMLRHCGVMIGSLNGNCIAFRSPRVSSTLVLLPCREGRLRCVPRGGY